MSEFRLEPWEVPVGSGAALVAPADAVIELRTGRLLFRAVRAAPGRFVLFVQRGLINFIVVNQGAFKPAVWKRRPTNQKLKRIAPMVGDGFGRMFGLATFLVMKDEATNIETNAYVRAFGFNAEATGIWVSPDFSAPVEFQILPQDDLKKSLQSALNTSSSPARVAWEWKHGSEEERAARVAHAERQWAEVEKLAEWLIHSVVPDPENCREIAFDSINSTGELRFSSRKAFSELGLTRPQTKLLEKWALYLGTIFTVRDDCVVNLHRNNRAYRTDFMLTPSIPTQHERIEARLRLREWLQHNAPDKIAELLS